MRRGSNQAGVRKMNQPWSHVKVSQRRVACVDLCSQLQPSIWISYSHTVRLNLSVGQVSPGRQLSVIARMSNFRPQPSFSCRRFSGLTSKTKVGEAFEHCVHTSSSAALAKMVPFLPCMSCAFVIYFITMYSRPSPIDAYL